MTYTEIIFIILLVILPILIAISTNSVEVFLSAVITILCIGGLIYIISSLNNDFKITSKFEIHPTYIKLDDEKLNVITDEYKHFKFTEYADILKYKNGCKFYKVYSYKQCVGFDEEKMELIIE
jgi:hypothetical protein